MNFKDRPLGMKWGVKRKDKSEDQIIKEAYKIANDDGLPQRPIDSKTPEEINELRRKNNESRF